MLHFVAPCHQNLPMARLFPTHAPRLASSAGEHAELVLLRTLESGLPGAYQLFHGVD